MNHDSQRQTTQYMNMRFSILTAFFLFISTFSFAQKEMGTAYDRNGKVVYIESFPANQYRHLGTVTCSAFSPDDVNPLIDHMLKQATKQFPDQEFDAIIFRQGSGLCKADIVQFYRDPKAKRKRPKRGEEEQINPEYKKSKANTRDGYYLFVKNSPSSPNKLLGKVELPATFKSSAVEDYISEMMKLAKNKYPKMEGVVFVENSNLMKANVIVFE